MAHKSWWSRRTATMRAAVVGGLLALTGAIAAVVIPIIAEPGAAPDVRVVGVVVQRGVPYVAGDQVSIAVPLLNQGDARGVVTRARFTVEDVLRIEPCHTAGRVDVSGVYDLTLPADTAAGDAFDVDVSQELGPACTTTARSCAGSSPRSASAPDRTAARGVPATAAALLIAVIAVTTAVVLVRGTGGTATLHALPPVPAPLWSADVPAGFAENATARVSGDVLVLAGGTGVAAYRLGTGEPLWRWDNPSGLPLRGGDVLDVTVAGDAVVVQYQRQGSDPPVLDVLDLATGRTRWRLRDATTQPDPVGVDLALTASTAVLVDCAYEPHDLQTPPPYVSWCVLTARALGDGAVLWTRRLPGNDYTPPGFVSAGQSHGDDAAGFTALDGAPDPDGTLIVVADAYFGDVNVVDAVTGESVGSWHDDVDAGWAYESAGGHLYRVGLFDGLVTGVAPGTGARLWTRQVRLDRNVVGALSSVPADVYFDVAPDQRSCRLVDLSTGALLPVDAAGWPLLAVTPRAVVGYDGLAGVLTAVEPASGRPLWTAPLDVVLGGGAQHGRSYADGRYLVVTAAADRPGGPAPRTWVVSLATGGTAAVPDTEVIGYSGGYLLSLTGAHALQLRRLL